MVNAPWYVINADIDRNLSIPTIKEEIKGFGKQHEDTLHFHENAEVLQLPTRVPKTEENFVSI